MKALAIYLHDRDDDASNLTFFDRQTTISSLGSCLHTINVNSIMHKLPLCSHKGPRISHHFVEGCVRRVENMGRLSDAPVERLLDAEKTRPDA